LITEKDGEFLNGNEMTIKSKAKYMLLLYRIRAAWKILFQPNLHWILISVGREEFIKHLKGEEVTMDFSYHKLQEYTFYDTWQSCV